MHFRLTQKLAKKVKVASLETLEMHDEPLLDWTANLFRVGRKQYIIACNTASLYSALCPAAGVTSPKRLVESTLKAIQGALAQEGFRDVRIAAGANVSFGKALNRQVTGSMKEQMNFAKILFEDPTLELQDVVRMLNGNLLSYLGKKSGDYGQPREAIRAVTR